MGRAVPEVRIRAPFSASQTDRIGDAILPRLPFAAAGAFLAAASLIPAYPPAIGHVASGEEWGRAALAADGALLLAALSMVFLRRFPWTRCAVVSLALLGLLGALAAAHLDLDGFRSDWPPILLVTSAGAFALGGLSVARCGNPSAELRLTLFAMYLGIVLAGALAAALTPLLGPASETAFCVSVLTVLVWRTAVLARRDAW